MKTPRLSAPDTAPAIRAGYNVVAVAPPRPDGKPVHLLVKPDTDFSRPFHAWDFWTGRFITVAPRIVLGEQKIKDALRDIRKAGPDRT